MGARRVVLIIDDDEMDLAAMQISLESQGYEVLTTRSGEEGLRRAQESPPDLVIVDLLMPPPDGFEVCRRLALDPCLRKVPRIVVTALHEKMHKAATSADVRTRVDADLYLDKPVDPDGLASCVRELVERHKTRE
ncbi:MAG: response regulator [Planctomycetota bacterium]